MASAMPINDPTARGAAPASGGPGIYVSIYPVDPMPPAIAALRGGASRSGYLPTAR